MKVESVRRSWLDRVMCVSRRVEVELSCGDRRMVDDGEGVERGGVESTESGGGVDVREERDVTDDDDNETSTDGCADDRGGEGVR
jgi:hypothetical protein